MIRKVFDAMPQGVVTVRIVCIKQELEKKIYQPLIKYANKSFQLKFQTSYLNNFKDENIVELIPEIKPEYERLQDIFLSENYHKKVIKFLKQIKGNNYEVAFLSHSPGICNILFDEMPKSNLSIRNNDKHSQFFDYLIEESNDALRIIDLNFNILYANQKYAELCNMEASQVVSRKCFDYYNSGYCNSDKCPVKLILNGKELVRYEVGSGHNDNHRINICDIVPLKGEGNKVEGIIESFRDITSIKKAEFKLKESEKKLRKYIEVSPLAIFVSNSKGECTYANESARNLLNYTTEELLTKTILDLTHDDYKNKIFKAFQQLLESGAFETEIVLLKKDQSSVNVKINSREISTDTYIAFCEDVTEFNKIQEKIIQNKHYLEETVKKRTIELENSESKFINIFNASNDLVMITSLADELLEANEITKERIKQLNLNFTDLNKDFLINDSNSLIIENYLTDLRKTNRANMEISYEYENHKKVYLEVHGKTIRYGDEKAFMHIARDITDRVTLERKILRKVFETEEKERSRFAKDLHDSLGVLLSAIKLKLSVLESKNINKEESLKIVKRCKDLITTATRASREIANNVRPYEIGDLGLVTAVNNLCNQIQIDGKLNISVFTDNLSKSFDREIEIILFKIINELINNTIKHSDAKNISIRLFDLFNKLFLVYTDDGKGFDIHKLNSNNMNSMGLKNMINRIKSINGKCEINSSVGSGVEVVIEINLIK